jgi:DNA-binding response OmpR family regulator
VGVVVADRSLAEGIAQDLRRAGRAVTVATSGLAADVLRACEHADLVVLDVDALGGAVELEALVRARPLLRVVALVRTGDAPARVAALRSGADDALTLPTDAHELEARVEAQLRRLDLSSGQRVVVEEGLVVDLSRLQVERGGRAFDLTPLEAGILGFVMREGHRVVGRDEILEAVWSDPTTRACARTVDVHIVALRRKLHGGSGSQRLIRTIRGIGYRWCG